MSLFCFSHYSSNRKDYNVHHNWTGRRRKRRVFQTEKNSKE